MSIFCAAVPDSDWFAPRTRGDEGLPLIEPLFLQDLEEQLGSADMVLEFAKKYTSMWEQRRRHLVQSLECLDRDAALDAAISLKVSSAMVGAVQLAHLTATLETVIRSGDLKAGTALLTLIVGRGIATMNELQASYISPAELRGTGNS